MALSLPLKHRTVRWAKTGTNSSISGSSNSLGASPCVSLTDASGRIAGGATTLSKSSGGNTSSNSGDKSCVSALSLEPSRSRRWAEYTPTPWADQSPANFGLPTYLPAGATGGAVSTRRARLGGAMTVSFAQDAASPSPVTSFSGRPSPVGSCRSIKTYHHMGSWDATPTPWGDTPSAKKFFDATPTPWADSAAPDFGSLSRLTRIQSGAEEQYDPKTGSPQTPSEKMAGMGRDLLRGAYGPSLDDVKISDVKIKNTFIDGLPEEEEEVPAMFKTTSAPMVIGAKARIFSPQPTRQLMEMNGEIEPATVTVTQAEGSQPISQPKLVEIKQAAPQSVTLVDANGEKARDLPSVGSALHGTGQCRPCAWFHKPQGCARGWECRHCHACDAEELRTRKKDKVAMLRAQEKAEKVQAQVQVPTTTRVFPMAPVPVVQCSRPLALSRLV